MQKKSKFQKKKNFKRHLKVFLFPNQIFAIKPYFCPKRKTYTKNLKDTDMKIFNSTFWRDAAIFLAALAIFFLIYIIIAYWPNIVEGFNRGWNG